MPETGTTPASVPEMLDAVARARPEALAVSCPDGQMSYSELVAESVAAASRLRATGIRRGACIAFLLGEASAQYIALLLGALRVGAVVATLNARAKAREVTFSLERACPSLLVTTSWFDQILDTAEIPAGCDVAVLDRAGSFTSAGPDLPPEEITRKQLEFGPDDAARIIFTSGTAAQPKGCLHSHGALVAQAQGAAERLRLREDDRYWTPLPLFHTAGWTMLAPLSCGASFHHPGRFEPVRALEQIVSEHCTVLFPGFETIWMQVLTHPRFDADDMSAVRLVVNVGSPERLRTMQTMLPHAPQVSNTGCTECSGWLAIGTADDSAEDRLTSCGRPFPGMEVRIVDSVTREDVQDGEVGELMFRGPSRLTEYVGDPEGTAAAIDPAGWFHTGDLLTRRPDGSLVYVSRLKDMLKVGGENVAAAEIEDHLLRHPAVVRASVVAAPDERYGEVAAAFVELRPDTVVTEEELISHCLGQIATFKVPRYIRFVSSWPMSGTKIKKADLRAAIASDLQDRGITSAPSLTNSPP
jgi:fatty-acyl-CoA synthase